MRYENKKMNREGAVFSTGRNSFDLSSVRVLHTGVDTIKQLFNCSIKPEILITLASAIDLGSRIISLGGIDWIFSKSGKTSGYQYIFKNIDLGFVVLLKSFYKEPSEVGPHLKIEVSPHLIDQLYPVDLDRAVFDIASLFCSDLDYSGIAAHICVDLKGLELPSDFEQRLVTHSKRQFKVNNISNFEFKHNEIATIHGLTQTYTFGNPSTLQFCLYDKTAQANKVDKIQFWETIWLQVGSVADPFIPEYQHGDTVRRLEFRFHHSVINEFANGTHFEGTKFNIRLKNFNDLSQHLTALWQYALNSYRLQHSSVYIDPLWQLLLEDIQFFAPAPDLFYKRQKKAPSGNSRRNVAYWLGNALRLYARQNATIDHVVNCLLSSGLNDQIADYLFLKYSDRDLLRPALFDWVDEKLKTHQLNGVAV